MITGGKDELTADEPMLDTLDEDVVDELDEDELTELPTDDKGLLLVGTTLDDPPLPPPPQASRSVDTHNSNIRLTQASTDRVIIVLSRPMWPRPLLI